MRNPIQRSQALLTKHRALIERGVSIAELTELEGCKRFALWDLLRHLVKTGEVLKVGTGNAIPYCFDLAVGEALERKRIAARLQARANANDRAREKYAAEHPKAQCMTSLPTKGCMPSTGGPKRPSTNSLARYKASEAINPNNVPVTRCPHKQDMRFRVVGPFVGAITGELRQAP